MYCEKNNIVGDKMGEEDEYDVVVEDMFGENFEFVVTPSITVSKFKTNIVIYIGIQYRFPFDINISNISLSGCELLDSFSDLRLSDLFEMGLINRSNGKINLKLNFTGFTMNYILHLMQESGMTADGLSLANFGQLIILNIIPLNHNPYISFHIPKSYTISDIKTLISNYVGFPQHQLILTNSYDMIFDQEYLTIDRLIQNNIINIHNPCLYLTIMRSSI